MNIEDDYRKELHNKLYAYKDQLKSCSRMNKDDLEMIVSNVYCFSEYVMNKMQPKKVGITSDIYLYCHAVYYESVILSMNGLDAKVKEKKGLIKKFKVNKMYDVDFEDFYRVYFLDG